MGVKLLESINMQTNMPLDDRSVVQTIVHRDAIPSSVRYLGMKVYVSDEKKEYRLEDGIENTHWTEMKAIAKASELITDDNHLTVSTTEKEKWNSKAEVDHKHSEYQIKGDYAVKSHKHNATDITQDETHRFVTDTDKSNWNSKAAGNHNHDNVYSKLNHKHTTLSIQLNSGSATVYDGSIAKSINITPASIGAQAIGNYAVNGHTHDDRYFTETEVNNLLNGKANSSHGNHVPATQTASNKVFLRNDNTWATITPANIGAQPAGSYASGNHNHDSVYSKLGHGHTWGEISGKPGSFTPTSHNQASNTITAMTGYSKPTGTSAIVVGDSLNAAIGKLEKALDGKQVSGSYAPASHTHPATQITQDSTHRFSTDAEKTKWNGKADAHSHPYLNLAGGTLTGALTVNSTIKATGTVTCSDCVTTSDERLKKDIVKIDNALEKVNQLNGYTFLKEGDGQRTTGVLAQELLNVLPEAVFEREDGYYSVSYGNMVGLLIEAIKELQGEVRRLKGDC